MKTHHLLQEDEVVLDAGTPHPTPFRASAHEIYSRHCSLVQDRARERSRAGPVRYHICRDPVSREGQGGGPWSRRAPRAGCGDQFGCGLLPRIAQPNQGLRTELAIGYILFASGHCELRTTTFPHSDNRQRSLRLPCPYAAITPEDLRPGLVPTFERTASVHHANALALTASNGDQFGFYAFWTAATLDSAARHLRYAVLRRQELNRDAAPPAPRATMSGSFSHFRPPSEHPGRERSSSAGDVQLPVSCLLSTSDKPKRAAHSMHSHRDKHTLSRSSAGEASRHKAEVVSPRSPRSPRSGHSGHALHSVSMIAPISLRKSMSTRILDSHHNAFGLSRSPPSASGSFSFAYPASPASSSPSVSDCLASSSSSSALHGAALSDAVQNTLTRLRISTAEAPVDIMMGECEGNAM